MDDFRGLKNLPRIKAGGKSWCIARLLDSDGRYATDKQGIANAFASFYAELYRNRLDERQLDTVTGAAAMGPAGRGAWPR